MRNWICCQNGAREHYAVPRALRLNGKLQALYTDCWAGPVVRRLGAKAPLATLRSFSGRFHPELADVSVQSWNLRALLWEAKARQGLRNGTRYWAFTEVGRGFAIRVREELKRRRGLGKGSILFAYDTAALEALKWCKERGVKTVLGQMDPNRIEVDTVIEEQARWPGWQPRAFEVPECYLRRRQQEWDLADRVLVNSEFSRAALIKQGVPREKLVVIPLCYEGDKVPRAAARRTTTGNRGCLRVLFLGQVILRKGIQYLIQAARLLEGEGIRFDIVGPIGISREAVASAPQNMVFHGRSLRHESAAWYGQADVFVLPTLSDGFALTQLEAMSYGLPVIATPCCGEVVSDGVDGLIVPPREPVALAKALQRYLEPGLLQQHQAAAVEKAKQFTLERLADNLLAIEACLG